MTTDTTTSSPPAAGSATAHVKRVFALLAVVAAAAATARYLAYPESYGDFGHYRGDAVTQLMQSPEPLYQGKARCAECHEEEAGLLAKDVHNKVQCETCHGPGQTHIAIQNGEGEGKGTGIFVPRSQDACLVCHRRLLARPAGFPQVDPVEHFTLLHVKKSETTCSTCHSPHEPMFVEGTVAEARLHPVINECVDCHKHDQPRDAARPASHPVVFECGYCHGAVAKDHAERTHAEFRCGVCHQFYPESERAGRVLKHRDPRFCLLCHGHGEVKDDKAPPAVSWPQHRADMGGEDETQVCADCHREAFHLSQAGLTASAAGTATEVTP